MEHGPPHARAVYMGHGHGSCERLLDVRTGNSSLNFFQAVFTRVVTVISQLHQQKACHPGNRRKLPPPAYQVQPGLHSVVCRQYGGHFPCTPIIRIWCQSLKTAAFLIHPKFAAIAVECCCCLLLYDRQRMGIPLNSAGGPGLYHRS